MITMGKEIYTPELAAKVLERLADTGSLARALAEVEGAPVRNTIYRWIEQDIDGFAERYARAKEQGIDKLVEDTLTIADDGSNDYVKTEHGPKLDSEHVQRSKIRIETRRWLAERMAPKKYGLRQGLDVTNSDGSLAVDEAARSARVAQLLAIASKRKDEQDEFGDLA